jgi:hypothetical protein
LGKKVNIARFSADMFSGFVAVALVNRGDFNERADDLNVLLIVR